MESATKPRPAFTLSVVMECHDKIVNRWSSRQWKLSAILSDSNGPSSLEGPVLIRKDRSKAQYLWKGLRLQLYHDAAEGYWYNLLSDEPYAFVICETDDNDEDAVPMPYLITASQDEAGAHLETDGLVLSAPLPADIREKIEQFVVNNYVPHVKRKRKRKNWFRDSVRSKPGLDR